MREIVVALPVNIKLGWKRLAREKRSSLFVRFRQKFYNVDRRLMKIEKFAKKLLDEEVANFSVQVSFL